jgi:NAD(P) transhydrogenase
MYNYDLIVIGSGPAGQKAAIQAAKLGKKVAIIEHKTAVGGVSLHTGTIPSKTLRESVLHLSGWRLRGFYGDSYRVKEDITAQDIQKRLHVTLEHELEIMKHQLNRNGVKVLEGHARFVDPHNISVTAADGSERVYSADFVLIAVGTKPHRPDHIPFDEHTILDSDDILKIEQLPRSMIVVGAGVIGLEYATIFSALDIEITLVDAQDSLLGFVDKEIVDELLHVMRDRNMTVLLGERVVDIHTDERKRVITKLASGKHVVSHMALFAAGRQGATDLLAIENAGLSVDKRGRLAVNDNYQTEQSHIYAAGDVIGFPSLASTSMEQGRLSACHAFGLACHSRPETFPFGIYAVPEISMVGATEQELKKQQIPYEVGSVRMRETARGQIMGIREGMLKILFSIEDQRVLGVHIIGIGATEAIHIGQAVMSLGGTLDYFVDSVFNYPTLAEAYKVAALDAWNKLNLN